MNLETITVRQEEAVLLAEIAAPKIVARGRIPAGLPRSPIRWKSESR